MSKKIQYSDEPLGDLTPVADFLPSPDDQVLKQKNTKVTLSLSSESVAFFKSLAHKHHLPYQRLIRELLDAYVDEHKAHPLRRTRRPMGD